MRNPKEEDEDEDEEASGWIPSQDQSPVCINFFLISFPCPSLLLLGHVGEKNSFGTHAIASKLHAASRHV